MMKTLMICTMLLYGGIIDYKKREIPNIVPIVILCLGFTLDLKLLWSIVCLSSVAVIFLIADKLTKGDLPGGDFKLLCALAFTIGLLELSLTLALTGLGAVTVAILKGKDFSRHIPLCTYLAPAYILLQATLLGVIAMQ